MHPSTCPGMTIDEAMAMLKGEPGPQSGASNAKQEPPAPEKPKIYHRFAKQLALRLNPAHPDITGALVIYGLNLWHRSAEKKRYRLPNGISCYRSLSELKKDLPYLGESTIHTALGRLEQRLGPDQFRVIRDKKHLSFVLGDEIDPLCAEPLIGFRIEDAVNHGVTQAIMLEHLNFANTPESVHQPVWHEDRAYYYVSSTVLSRKDPEKNNESMLPLSRSTIQAALDELMKKEILLKHPHRPSHYGRRHYPVIELKKQKPKTER